MEWTDSWTLPQLLFWDTILRTARMAAIMEPNNVRMEELRKLKIQLAWRYRLLDLLRKLLKLQTKVEKLQWEEKAREIARAYNIDEDIFVAVLYCESGMNPKAVNRNKNGTTDYGIAQFNDYWYRDIIDPWVALNDPEEALRRMAKAWQDGRQNDWICYRNKKYIAWLKP